ncbi:MAG: mechanosensitive ion channel family protein, partial [Gemmatimonadota bacterium]
MDFLETTYLGNPLRAWLVAAAIAVAALIVLRVVTAVLHGRLAKRAARTTNDLNDLAADLVGKTRLFFLFFLAVYIGAQLVELPAKAAGLVRAAAVIALLLQGAFWANEVLAFWIHRWMKKRIDQDPAAATSIAALRFIGKLAVWTFVLLLALDNLGVDVTALVTGLGVGGIAVALAAQNILSDLFASLTIVFDKPFVIGDFIIVGDQAGTVEYIGLKTTRVRSLWGEQLVFANSDLLSSRIRNFKRMHERRIVFKVGVVYGTSHEKVRRIPGMIREIIEAEPLARFDRAHFQAFGNFSLDFEMVYWVK